MTSGLSGEGAATAALMGAGAMLAGPLGEIAQRLSNFIRPVVAHEALVIFTRECTGRPRKVAGDPALTTRVTVAEMQTIRDDLIAGATTLHRGPLRLGGVNRPGIAVLDAETGILLVLVANRIPNIAIPRVCAAFGLAAISIRHQVTSASPSYLAESRAASVERARTIVQMADRHGEVLTELLAVLRSTQFDDGRARTAVLALASEALSELRTAESSNRNLAEESATVAFGKLRNDLGAYLQHKSVEVEFVAPRSEDLLIPGEVARGVAALVRSAAMGLADQDVSVNRMRICWDCDATRLVVEVRDDGGSDVAARAIRREVTERAQALGADLAMDCTPGWGTRLSVAVPLDAARGVDRTPLAALNAREIEVLSCLARGWRNKEIGGHLHITESTVKFHVTRILQKLGASNRAEAGALAVQCGLVDVVP